MPAVQKKVSKKLRKKAPKKQLPVVKKVVCKAHTGEPCVARALMMETVLEALAGTVWYHRQDTNETIQFVIRDLALVDIGHRKGHFTLMVEVDRLHGEMHDKAEQTYPLHNFFQVFYPAREININDCQA